MQPPTPFELAIETLDNRARGVAHKEQMCFVCDGALPGEHVIVQGARQTRQHFDITAYEIVRQSSQRIHPRCDYFAVCGGCQLQHVDDPAQLEMKQSALQTLLQRNSISPVTWQTPLSGEPYYYRHRARLGVFQLPDGTIIIGFRRRHHSHLVDLVKCETLVPQLARLLPPLHDLVRSLSCANRIPQIEMAAGDENVAVVLRHLVELTAKDQEALLQFAQTQQILLYTQAAGPDSIVPVDSVENKTLSYSIDKFRLEFQPTDFIQANTVLNRALALDIVEKLELKPNDQVLELFSGLGNFTLPIAVDCRQVTALEGHPELIRRAQHNAQSNGVTNVNFLQTDLRQPAGDFPETTHSANKLLLDPPREGAIEVLKQLCCDNIERIVYVSCNPETLSRDLGYLVHLRHFKLESIRLVDMFPQTVHTEAVATLRRA